MVAAVMSVVTCRVFVFALIVLKMIHWFMRMSVTEHPWSGWNNKVIIHTTQSPSSASKRHRSPVTLQKKENEEKGWGIFLSGGQKTNWQHQQNVEANVTSAARRERQRDRAAVKVASQVSFKQKYGHRHPGKPSASTWKTEWDRASRQESKVEQV